MKKKYLFESDYNKLLRENIKDYLNISDSKFLNIACEYRLIPEALQGEVNPESVYGLELNKEIVKNNPKIKLCDVDNQKFPFEDNFFDCVLSIWGIEHFQTDNIFKESSRVLKKGGKLIFITPSKNHPVFFINKLFGGKFSTVYYKYLSKIEYKPHQTYYRFNSVGKIKSICKKHDYTFKEVIYFGPSYISDYFAFSKILLSLVIMVERLITNRVLGFFKPFILCFLEKGKEIK